MTPRPPRRIRVDGLEYRWTVQVVDPNHVAVRVWLDGSGRRRQIVVSVEFDDYWLFFPEILPGGETAAGPLKLEPVTPGLTAALVRAGIAAGWQPEAAGAPLHFVMVGDRTAFVLAGETSR